MNMITQNHNYDNGYIGLVNLELANLPTTLVVDEYKLLLKTKLHISLICVKRIAPIIDEENAGRIETEIVEFFKQFIERTPLTTYDATGQFRLVKRDERVSLVGLVTVPGIDELFMALEEKYKVKLPLQPTHITLYTLQPEAGIGILSKEQLESDSQAVNVPITI